MNDQRVGAAFRAVRLRRGWRQKDVGAKGHVSPALVSLIENGRLERVSPAALRRVASVLGVRVEVSVRLPAGEIDRLLNAGHAILHEELARYLSTLPGWIHAPEVSFAIYGERGVIDILAFHEPTGSLLVIELKTELVSLEDLLSTMDVRLRHAARIARERGWLARSVSAWVVVADSDANRRRVGSFRALLGSAFPSDGHAIRKWLRQPEGTIRSLSFWAKFSGGNAKQRMVTRKRVRVPKPPNSAPITSTVERVRREGGSPELLSASVVNVGPGASRA